MAKPSAFVMKMQQQAKKQSEMDSYIMKRYTIQQALDMAVMVLGEEFGFGEERAKKFTEGYNRKFSAYINDAIEDNKSDPEIIYTRERIERQLRSICGKYYVPEEERYSFLPPYYMKAMR